MRASLLEFDRLYFEWMGKPPATYDNRTARLWLVVELGCSYRDASRLIAEVMAAARPH